MSEELKSEQIKQVEQPKNVAVEINKLNELTQEKLDSIVKNEELSPVTKEVMELFKAYKYKIGEIARNFGEAFKL